MLYSKHKNFIFVHIFKTGGTSITESLLPHVSNPILSLLNRVQRKPSYDRSKVQPCFKHATAAQIRDAVGPEVYDKAFTFAFVRNPFDLEVSLYKYLLRWEKGPNYLKINAMGGFSEFVKWHFGNGIRSQRSFLQNADGRMIVKFVGRFENLACDFRHVAQTLGVRASLKHENASVRKAYQCYYTCETEALIKEAYAEDLEFFDYAYEDR